MKKYEFYGKTVEEGKENAFKELDITENDAFFSIKEEKGGLFKAKKVEVTVIKKEDVIEYIKDFLKNIIKLMGIEDINIETKSRDGMVTITLYSDNNAILIGKNGRTLQSLSTIIKQSLYNEIGCFYHFALDVSEYKVKQQRNIERLALNIAKEVANTKIEATLDPMNSYERRVVHAVLNDHKYVYTESSGEEPNRCVVIKPREE